MERTARALAFAGLLVAPLACGRGEERPAAASTTAARTVTIDDAARRITAARCEREVGCNNVGPGKRFEERSACLRELERDARATVPAEECVSGVDDARLATCVLDIENGRCGSPLPTAERIPSCRRTELCASR
jgi:hypothetical protein